MTDREKILFVFGTRPEAIKMSPVIKEFGKHQDVFEPFVVATAQHREMLDQVLGLFKITPDYDLDIMGENQSLEDVTTRCLERLSEIIQLEKPGMVFVQGDTTTTFSGALASYYNKVPVCHIEAGLRSHDNFQPFPEEVNRRLTTVISDIHFAPTKLAEENLLAEGIPQRRVFITGNTVIDALLEIANRKYEFQDPLDKIINSDSRLILVTAHRRESFGKPIRDICHALEEITGRAEDVNVLFPVHPNPQIKKTVYESIKNTDKIHLISPLDYEPFVHIMKNSYLILTDSGGVQEEAPSLGKPVLVLRDKTERREAIEAGTAKLVGTDAERIIGETLDLLNNEDTYNHMAATKNPYGDGKASKRIFDIISNFNFAL